MNRGDKIYGAWVLTQGESVLFHEHTIKEVGKSGVWIENEDGEEEYEFFEDIELNYGKTKAEAIDKCIQTYQRYIKEYEYKIKILEQEKEAENEIQKFKLGTD